MLRQHLLFVVLLQKRGVPTGYLEAQSLKRTRGFSDPYRRQEWLVYVGFCAPSLDTPAGFANASFQAGAGFESGGLLCRTGVNHQIVDGAAFGPQC